MSTSALLVSDAKDTGDRHAFALNVATLGLVDEVLCLPSAPVAITAIGLLYGRDVEIPARFLDQVGLGAQALFASLLTAEPPLATLLPSRLGPAAAWRDGSSGLKGARALARNRYRQLQAAFLSSTAGSPPATADALVRYTYGVRGHWLWADAARRILDRVVVLNRAMLALLAAVARGESRVRVTALGTAGPPRVADLTEAALDLLAEALPPVAIPEFTRLSGALAPAPLALAGDESIERYQSLFAEMLSRSGSVEVPS